MSRHKKNPEDRCIGVGVSLTESERNRIDAFCAVNGRSAVLRLWIIERLTIEEGKRLDRSPAYTMLGGDQ